MPSTARTWPYRNPYFEMLPDDSRECTSRDIRRLRELRDEYVELIQSRGPGQLSLHDLMSPIGLGFDKSSAHITHHPDMESVIADVESWMRENQMWLTTTPHIIYAPSWMFPTAITPRIPLMTKVLGVDWHLNDTQGRDLSTHRATDSAPLITTLIAMCDDLDNTPRDQSRPEQAVRELLRAIRADSPPTWFACFLGHWRDHVELTHQDLTIPSAGGVPSLFGYTQQRNCTAGMVYCTSLVEFGTNAYFRDFYRESDNLTSAVDRLAFLASVMPSLGNDVVSFEKEIIDLGSSNNLIAVMALNRPESSLLESIRASAGMVADMIQEFATLMKHTVSCAADMRSHDEHRAVALLKYLDGLDRMMKSVWTFQIRTLRYRYPRSIWKELMVYGKATTRHAEAGLRHSQNSGKALGQQ